MLRININPADVLGFLNEFEQKQLPFVLALTLTRTARLARERVQKEMAEVFDRPTPATIKGVLFHPARPGELISEVYIKDEFGKKALSPNKWLLAEIEGGFRRDKRMEVALKRMGLMPNNAQAAPSRHAPLDPYGNLRGSFVTKILSQLRALDEIGYKANETDDGRAKKIRKGKRPTEFFVGRPEGKRGRLGLWERLGTSWGDAIRPIVYFVRPHNYQARLPFYAIVQQVHDRETASHLKQAMADALATAHFKGKWSHK